MRLLPSAQWLLILGTAFVPEPPQWEVVRSEDGDFAFSTPAKPDQKTQDARGSAETPAILTYSCRFNGSRYLVQRTRSARSVAPGRVIDELADLKKGFAAENAQFVNETKIVVDGVIGDDFTYTVPSHQRDGDVTKRTRHYLTGSFYYVLTVASPPGRALPDDAARFLSSLTFEAVVKAHYARMKAEPRPAAEPKVGTGRAAAQPRGNAPRATAQPKGSVSGPGRKAKPADSTPDDALKTFLLALAAQDEATLRAVTLPDDEFDWLLKGPAASPDFLAQLEARLDEKPMRRLKAGDPVRMPDGEARFIKPVDVSEGRVVLWPEGAPLPSRLENVGGHWKVFARPFIASRKSARVNPEKPQPNSAAKPHGLGR
jgi:hypothetical protein